MKKKVVIGIIAATVVLATAGLVSASPLFSQANHAKGASMPFHQKGKGVMAAKGIAKQIVFTVATQDLNMTAEELKAQLQAGKSLNDIATAKGGDVKAKLAQNIQDALSTKIKQALQDGKLTAVQAAKIQEKLPQQVQNILSRTKQAGEHKGLKDKVKGKMAARGIAKQTVFTVAAKDLNLTVDALKAQLLAGKSLNDIAIAQGVDVKTKLAQDIQAALTEKIEQAVKDRKLTADQAAKIQEKLPQQVQNYLSRTMKARAFPKMNTTNPAPAPNS